MQKTAKKTFSSVGFALLLFFAVSLGVSLLLSLLCAAFYPQLSLLHGISATDLTILISGFSMYICGLPVFLLFLRKKERRAPGTTPVRFDELVVLFFIAIFFLYFGNTAGLLIGELLSHTGLALQNTTIDAMSDANLWLTLLFTVVLAPVCEELMFRKTVIDCTAVYGEKLSILFSALLFGFFHANLYQFFYAVLIGLLLGYAYTRTGKLWVTVLLHAAVNFCGTLPLLLEKYTGVLSLAEDYAASGAAEDAQTLIEGLLSHLPQTYVMYQYAVAANVVVLFGAAVYFVFRRRTWFANAERQLPRDSEGVTAFTAPGVILFVLFSLALTVYESYALSLM